MYIQPELLVNKKKKILAFLKVVRPHPSERFVQKRIRYENIRVLHEIFLYTLLLYYVKTLLNGVLDLYCARERHWCHILNIRRNIDVANKFGEASLCFSQVLERLTGKPTIAKLSSSLHK